MHDLAERFRQRVIGRYALPRQYGSGAAVLSLKDLWEGSGLSGDEFADEVAEFASLPRLGLQQLLGCALELDGFSPRFLRESKILPYRRLDRSFGVAVADPFDTASIRGAEIVLGQPVSIAIASFEDIAAVLEERLDAGPATRDDAKFPSAQSADDIETLRDLASGAPVVRALNDLLERAMDLRASDIHIEPFRKGLIVRMRIDGLLRNMPTPPDIPPQALISRIKILAGLDIAERRLPQDGAARVRVSRAELDIRVAVMPTQHGESAVIRLLPRDRGLLEMSKLGLNTRDEATLRQLLTLPHGMIIVTGPTGSGKTTTLATMLTMLNETSRKILTIEDPVEYEIAGINQSQVKPSIGLTFAAAMRSFLRQDPDVIMVGEIRDSETAHIAIHAALTGHLVLTTLHTETAAAAVPRLLDLGVESFLLRSTLRAAIGQRLLRILCERCKTSHPLSRDEAVRDPRFAMLGLRMGDAVFEAVGCERCGGVGYRGRFGAFEVLEMTDRLRPLIHPQTDARAIDGAAIEDGMTTMLDDAVAKCRAGLTTVSEVLRVTTVR